MSEIPWWGLPLIAAVFALAGAGTAMIVSARNDYARGRVRKTRRWYEERMSAYTELMAAFDRVVYRLRTGYAARGRQPDPMAYLDEVGPALMRVRLLASGPVRSAALAAHLLLEKLHETGKPAAVPGVDPEKHGRELLAQVPLVLQEFEAAAREELEITPQPPAVLTGFGRTRLITLRRPARIAEVPEKEPHAAR
ncbi:hypothetical protein [Mangrovihabitans endophyticus]|uniref:Uncharacterized protein n=1 Tax=Mangrovihabitans endophyticus TaxID=1751298 RepID=A0A8J3BY55_9ACTN|nr:hypothetical protein [Mangrovihabitans endophyticus]GGK81098.1 hypothetical protein GCM10012284_13800 [Mangrovihabitans endophyticus]